MPVFILEMRHSPDMCPVFNEKVGKKFKEQYNKIKEIANKLEIKILINLGVFNEHYILMVLGAPSIETAEEFIKETDLFSFNTVNVKHAYYSDDIMKSLE